MLVSVVVPGILRMSNKKVNASIMVYSNVRISSGTEGAIDLIVDVAMTGCGKQIITNSQNL